MNENKYCNSRQIVSSERCKRWFLFRGCVFRPGDACQKRFLWFSDWIQKVETLESQALEKLGKTTLKITARSTR